MEEQAATVCDRPPEQPTGWRSPKATITNEGGRFVLMECCRLIPDSAAGNNESSPRSCRKLVPGAAVQQAPTCLRCGSADLFEEQRNLHADAAVPQVTHPAQVQRPEIGAVSR